MPKESVLYATPSVVVTKITCHRYMTVIICASLRLASSMRYSDQLLDQKVSKHSLLLQVQENLEIAARLRMPRGAGDDDDSSYVEQQEGQQQQQHGGHGGVQDTVEVVMSLMDLVTVGQQVRLQLWLCMLDSAFALFYALLVRQRTRGSGKNAPGYSGQQVRRQLGLCSLNSVFALFFALFLRQSTRESGENGCIEPALWRQAGACWPSLEC
jgi:hypothetical protein